MDTSIIESIKDLEMEFTKSCIKNEVLDLFNHFPLIREGYRISNAHYRNDGTLFITSHFSVLKNEEMDEWKEEFIFDGNDIKYADGNKGMITDGLSKLIFILRLKDDGFDDAIKRVFQNIEKEDNYERDYHSKEIKEQDKKRGS